MNYDKIPPQAKEVEAAVLGAIMSEKRAFEIVAEILTPECFYVDSHQSIFTAMVKINQRSQAIDILTVIDELIKMGCLEQVGGPYEVTKLTNTSFPSSLTQHALIVKEKFMKREIIRIGSEMVQNGYQDATDIFDLIDTTEKSVFAISNSLLKKDFQTLQTVGAKVITRIDTLRASDQVLSGVPSGFRELDRITYGWQQTDLIILAARPSVGKTAFALNLARNAANDYPKKTSVGFFSLEMSAEQLVQRLLSAESGVFMSKISQGRIDETDYLTIMSKAIKKFDKMDIFIDDSPALNIFEFRHRQGGINPCRRNHLHGTYSVSGRGMKSGYLIIEMAEASSDNRRNRSTSCRKVAASRSTLRARSRILRCAHHEPAPPSTTPSKTAVIITRNSGTETCAQPSVRPKGSSTTDTSARLDTAKTRKTSAKGVNKTPLMIPFMMLCLSRQAVNRCVSG
jgi:hypothetical protein